MNASELIARARSALGRGVVYSHGPVDFDSESLPASGMDCSSFVLWALRHGGGDMDTSGIVAAAGKPASAATGAGFSPKLDAPRPGCLIVYPDYESRVWGRPRSHHGHVGIVTGVGTVDGRPRVTSVIHCSQIVQGVRAALLPDLPPDSIVESGPLWFDAFDPVWLWYRGIEQE